ncbi:hypothetical protein CLOP_g1996 [Closterium sp. NIES-67]|nr:hypothetical protein CLOP_g1996 [Closterium sp. NIES-67]
MGSEGGFRGRQGRSADLSSSADSGRPQDLASLAAYSAPLWERGIPALRSQRQSPDPPWGTPGGGGRAGPRRGRRAGLAARTAALERQLATSARTLEGILSGVQALASTAPMGGAAQTAPGALQPRPCHLFPPLLAPPHPPSLFPASAPVCFQPASALLGPPPSVYRGARLPMAPPTLDTPAASSGALPEWQPPPQSFVPDHWAPGLPARAAGVGVYGPFVPPRRLAVSPNGVEEGAEAAETGGMESSEEISPGFRAQSRTQRPVGTRSQPGAQEDGLPGRRQTGQVVAVPAATFRRMCQTRRAFGLLAVVVEATHSALLGSESSRKMQHSHLRTSSDAVADLVELGSALKRRRAAVCARSLRKVGTSAHGQPYVSTASGKKPTYAARWRYSLIFLSACSRAM